MADPDVSSASTRRQFPCLGRDLTLDLAGASLVALIDLRDEGPPPDGDGLVAGITYKSIL